MASTPTRAGRYLLPNGVDAASGEYLWPRLSLARLAAALGRRGLRPRVGVRLAAGIDPRDLARTGWGVIFPPATPPAVHDALVPLLRRRRQQAGRRFRELDVRPEETKEAFTRRHGRGPGAVDGEGLPYYLLIVGGPEAVPYSFQYQLAVSYAVGRLDFDDAGDYRAYARAVLAAERDGHRAGGRRVAFFAPRHPDDGATELSCEHLGCRLAWGLDVRAAELEKDWTVERHLAGAATKERLGGLLGIGGEAPDLLFTAGHGLGFAAGAASQRRQQGALLCQGWPGPVVGKGRPISRDHYLCADDLDEARPAGLISFHFACHSAGTPRLDSFSHLDGKPRRQLAPAPFVAALPRRLLAHPEGGALAMIGHVDTAWECSFFWHGAGSQLETFRSVLVELLTGKPVGAAMEHFGRRHGEIAADLVRRIEVGGLPRGQADPGEDGGDAELGLAALWLANNDARSYVVLGDPAVRLPG